MIFLAGAIAQIFDSTSTSIFGSAELFALVAIIAIAFFLFFMNIPALFVFMCTGLAAMAFFSNGSTVRLLIGIAGVVLGTLVAFAIWSIFKKGD